VTAINTPRLILRELNPDDAPFILELLNEADFLRFIGDKGVRNLAGAREYIRKGPVDSYVRNGFGLYAACLRDGSALGICGLVKRDGLSAPDLGFAFLARHRCKGYALAGQPCFDCRAREGRIQVRGYDPTCRGSAGAQVVQQ
jgi:RimJ/RimL family protein N-acetyltransferase